MELGPVDPNAARGAVCSAHPEVPATSTCLRCGDFLCEACRTEGESVCASCRARALGAPLPFDRNNFDVGAALSHAWNRFQAQWLPLTAAGVTAYIVPMAVQWALMALAGVLVGVANPGSSQIDQAILPMLMMIPAVVASVVLQSMFYLAGYRVALDVLEGRAPSLASYFGAMKRTPTALLQMLLLYLALFLAVIPLAGLGFAIYSVVGEDAAAITVLVVALALILPMIWAMLGLAFLWPEIAYDPKVSAIESIKRSWQIAKGQRINVFLMGVLVILVAIAGFLMCCVGYLPALGFTFLLHATVYLGLRRGLLPAVER